MGTTEPPIAATLIRSHEVERRTGLSRSTIWRLESKGEFPRRVPLTGTKVGRLAHEVEDWINGRAAKRVAPIA